MVVVIGVLLGGVLVAVLLGGLGGVTVSTTSGGSGPAFPLLADGDEAGAQVLRKRESSGRSFFGLLPGNSTFTVILMIPVTQACADVAGSGGRWPSAEPACASDAEAGDTAEGEIIGGGTLATGSPTIVIAAAVSQRCYEAAGPGAAWPPDNAECP